MGFLLIFIYVLIKEYLKYIIAFSFIDPIVKKCLLKF